MRRILLILVAAAVAVVGSSVSGVLGALAAVLGSWPPTHSIEAPDLVASTDPAQIARGEYLFHAVAHCSICHTPKDDFWHHDDPRQLSPKGGHVWEVPPLGTLRSANLTSDERTGLGGMSDPDLARLVKYSVDPDGQVPPLMMAVGPMDDRDVVSLMSYIRSIPAVENQVEPTELSAIGKVLISVVLSGFTAPRDATLVEPFVPESDTPSIERGAYLANGPAYCFGCHSSVDPSGTMTFTDRFGGCAAADPDPEDPAMELCAVNLTPHPTVGAMRGWTEDDFVDRVRRGRAIDSSPMPWENYRLMTDADLRSIWRYLQSLEPIGRDAGPGHRKAGWSADSP